MSSARRPLDRVLRASCERARNLALPNSIDRFAGSALEFATLGAVVALFVAALV